MPVKMFICLQDNRKAKRWSRPALTHTFTRIYSYVFERCRTCDAYIYLGGYKCEKCNLYSHSKCLKSVVILCGQKPLSRRKAQVFGVPLVNMKEEVPFIVAKCCIEIESRGCKIRGIYRVNGVVSRVQRLIRSLENGPYLIDFSEANPNDLSHVLKEFFRSVSETQTLNYSLINRSISAKKQTNNDMCSTFTQLPQPIITSDLYAQFMNVAKKYRYSSTERLTPTTSESDNIGELREIVNKLPPQHKSTLSYLMHHLKFIAEHQQFNEMSAKNLGIVFAPTIFRMKDVDGNCFGMLFDNALQTLIIELLIKNSYEIFGAQPRVQLFNYG
ncbi:minor histocompatibility protein HA-1-like protein [Leptotrombidium deliense]|uniref:Minor histocompatibility protein HA-1-like protein n=1 Tax=Leptotrombidium deliense TaxID=299467 RepID=A0A443SCN8_9ACAR|nr:minor histocompatibility protein HA-1-like protein [Leptotrombidium deliense]